VQGDPIALALADVWSRYSSQWRPLYAKSERGVAGREP